MEREPTGGVGAASRDEERTTMRALSRRGPAMAMTCARPGASARSAPVLESTETIVVSLEIQEMTSGPSSLPSASRDSATRLVELPTATGRAGRWVMVSETGVVESLMIELTGFALAAA